MLFDTKGIYDERNYKLLLLLLLFVTFEAKFLLFVRAEKDYDEDDEEGE